MGLDGLGARLPGLDGCCERAKALAIAGEGEERSE